jgi:hypothetical protein
MLWTKRRLPGYRDWQIHSAFHGFEPLDWRKFYMTGASFPAPPVPKRPKDAVRTVIFGNIAWLPGWLLELLATLATSWLAHADIEADPDNPDARVRMKAALNDNAPLVFLLQKQLKALRQDVAYAAGCVRTHANLSQELRKWPADALKIALAATKRTARWAQMPGKEPF